MHWNFIFAVFFQISVRGAAWGRLQGSAWDRLQVTFGKFTPYPLTADQAETAGWKRDADCSGHANVFVGNRYINGEDESTRLIYDCDGSLAGIQATINETSDYPTAYNEPPWISTDNGQAALTVYFRRPKNICVCKGKHKKPPSRKPLIGDRLWVQLGDFRQCHLRYSCFMAMPLKKAQMAGTPWVEGTCIEAMGVHYHYNISVDFDCEKSFPIFLLFSQQTNSLIGFGWGGPVDVNSQSWEKPPPAIFSRSMKPESTPRCLLNYTTVSSQHVYFVDPLEISCI